MRIEWLLSPMFWAQSIRHYLIDKGIPTRIAKIFYCGNILIMSMFSDVDMLQKKFGGSASNMKVVGKKTYR